MSLWISLMTFLCSLAAGGQEHGDQKANHRNDETSE